MKVHLIRAIALLWLSGTLYVSFLLFSTKTNLQNLQNWGGSTGQLAVRQGLDRLTVGKPESDGDDDDNDHRAQAESPGQQLQQRLRQQQQQQQQQQRLQESYPTTNSSTKSGWSLYNKYVNEGPKRLFPVRNDRYDRVLNQIHHTPAVDMSKPPKLIYMRWGLDTDMLEGTHHFLKHECPVNWCSLTSKDDLEPKADLIYYHEAIAPVEHKVKPEFRNPKQLSLWFQLESPMNTVEVPSMEIINWTATYRTDSVLNTPYERFAYFKNFTGLPKKPHRNFAKGKTKMVAWFVSNCWAGNRRMIYAQELAKYINVDIYGACGNLQCFRTDESCDKILRDDYKFYLSFENSNCKDYITEKFFVNALKNDILPIVMGARPEDYERLAPPKSFIHVDNFESPKALAEYLHLLNRNDDLYNQYFLWKGAGEMIDTKFWCRLCSLLHEVGNSGFTTWQPNLKLWWEGNGMCIRDRGDKRLTWKQYYETLPSFQEYEDETTPA